MQYLYSSETETKTREQNAGTLVLLKNYGTKGSFQLSLFLLKLQAFRYTNCRRFRERRTAFSRSHTMTRSITIQISRLFPELACPELHGLE